MRRAYLNSGFLLLLLSAACGDDDARMPTTDAGTRPDRARGASDCQLDGTYRVTRVQAQDTACADSIAVDEPLLVRTFERLGTYVELDGAPFPRITARGCGFMTTSTPWLRDGVSRTYELSLERDGDRLSGRLLDRTASCTATYEIEAMRTGDAPEGAAVGVDACGGLGCSDSLCAFGGRLGCATGLCTFDARTFDSICTDTCTTDADCPGGLVCRRAGETYDDAPEGSYCFPVVHYCGDGVIDAGEACDDGNRADGDGCSSDCSSNESCGNGRIDPGEECDGPVMGEWLDCDACKVSPPAGTSWPLPLGTYGVHAIATGPSSYALAGGSWEGGLVVATTDDGGASWASHTFPIFGQLFALLPHGDGRLRAFLTATETSFLVYEIDGDRIDEGTTITLAEGTVVDEYTAVRIRVAEAGDGALLALAVGEHGPVMLRVEGTTAMPVGRFGVPANATNCRYSFDMPRGAVSYGAGAFIATGDRVVAQVSSQCWSTDSTGTLVDARIVVSRDQGRTFGAPIVVGSELQIQRATAIVSTMALDGSYVACATGTSSVLTPALVCGSLSSSEDRTLARHSIGFAEIDVRALAATDASTWLVVTADRDPTLEYVVHRTENGGETFGDDLSVPWTGWEGLAFSLLDAHTALLFAVDDFSNVEVTRFGTDLRGVTTAPLFDRPTGRDGSGEPWRLLPLADGTGAGLLVFYMPDTLRRYLTFTKPLR